MALTEFHESIHIAENSICPNHPSIAGTYFNKGNTYLLMNGDYSKALSFYEKAREIFESNGAFNNPDLATVYYQIGDAHCMKREYGSALYALEKALKIQENNLPSDHLSISRTCFSMAKVFYDLHDDQQAFKHLKRAIEIARKDETPVGAEVLKICLDLDTYMREFNPFRR